MLINMKKLLSILLFFCLSSNAQTTLIKAKQLGDGLGTGSVVVTGGPNGSFTYQATSSLPFATTTQVTSSLSAYVPYTGATTSVDLGANSLSVNATSTVGSAGNRLIFNNGVYNYGNNGTNQENVFYGKGCGTVTTAGIESAVFGLNSAPNNSIGNGNSIFGTYTARSFTNAGQNCVFASDALSSATVTSGNNVMGVQALTSYTGVGYNNSIGLQNMRNLITGSMNIGNGYRSAETFTNGDWNIFLGANTSGLNQGRYNTLIGSNIIFPATSFSNNIILSDGQGNIKYRWDGSKSTITGPLYLTGGSSSLPALSMSSQVAVATPSNGNIWLESETTNGWIHYLNDATNAGYHTQFKNSTAALGIYLSNAGGSKVQFGSTTNDALGFFVNGGAPKIRISTAGNVGINTTQDVASTFSVAGDVGINTTATVTGAFLANSTATVTGNLRASANASVFGNLSTTGTGSVGSNFTVTGNSLFTGTVQASSSITAVGVIQSTSTRGWLLGELAGVARIGYFSGEFQAATSGNSDADFRCGILRATNKIRVGSSVAPTNVLDVTGGAGISTTLTVGNTNTVTGPATAGTMAVMTDVLFSTTHYHSSTTIGTTTIYYDKSLAGVCSNPGATGGCGITYLPYDCTLVGYSLTHNVFGTLGSNNNATVSVRVNNTTDITLTSVAKYSAGTQHYNASNLNTNVNAGDYIEIKVIPNNTPTAATTVQAALTLYWKRR